MIRSIEKNKKSFQKLNYYEKDKIRDVVDETINEILE